MSAIANTVKRVPTWAWVASGGVVIGAVVVRYTRQVRGSEMSTRAEGDATAVGDYGQTAQAPGGSTSVLVPPVVIGSQDDGSAIAGLSELFVGGVNTLVDQFQTFTDGLIDSNQDNFQSGAGVYGAGVEAGQGGVATAAQIVAAALTGGGAPQSAAPSVVVTLPPQAAIPAATPVQAAPPVQNPPANPCGSSFPLYNASRGGCYRNTTATRVPENDCWEVNQYAVPSKSGRADGMVWVKRIKTKPC